MQSRVRVARESTTRLQPTIRAAPGFLAARDTKNNRVLFIRAVPRFVRNEVDVATPHLTFASRGTRKRRAPLKQALDVLRP